MPHHSTICPRCHDDTNYGCDCVTAWPDPEDFDDGPDPTDFFSPFTLIGEPDDYLAPVLEAISDDPPHWPSLPWIVRWSTDGDDPLVVAWNATRNVHAMVQVCNILDQKSVMPRFGFKQSAVDVARDGKRVRRIIDAIEHGRPRFLQQWERIQLVVEPPRLASLMQAAAHCWT